LKRDSNTVYPHNIEYISEVNLFDEYLFEQAKSAQKRHLKHKSDKDGN